MDIFIHKKKLAAPIKLASFLFFFILPYIVSAQTETLPPNNAKFSGVVIDAITKQSIPGAIIKIKGTTHAVAADDKGRFSFITAQKFPSTLVVSFVGYKTQEVIANGGYVEVALEENISQLNDVVVVGYGTQQRKDLVSSVSKVDPSQTKNIPDGSFDAQMQGKAAGVQINSNTGIAGSDVFIRIRGTTSINASNDPLYVIDGVFVNTVSLQNIAQQRTASPLADINPADILSIEILKDAIATAIYGSRGANGVVLVTTKRGNYDQKPKIDFNTSQGSAWAPASRVWKTTTGPQHAMLINEYDRNMGIPEPFVAGNRGLPQDQPTYDRMAILDQTGHLQNYDLSLQGGAKNTKYYVGAGYNSQEAVWKPISFSRASLKVNLDTKISDKVSVGFSNTLSDTYRDGAFAANGGNGTLLQASLNIPTYLPIFLPDGTPAKWVNFDNIYVLTHNNNLKSTSLHYIGNFHLDAELLPGLKFRSSWGADYDNYNESQYWGTQTVLGAAPTNGLATSSITQASSITNEQTLQYNKTIDKHTFGLLIGNTLQSNVVTNSTENGTNFPNNTYTLISAAATQTASQTWTKNTLESYFARANYNYNDKYFLEFTFRADGSSKFAADHKWGYFPAAGAAWRISEEDFLKNNTVISNLKLRASYGITGNQNGINDFAAQGLWNAGYGYADNTTGGEKPGTAPLQLPNPNLTWERTSQANLGLDIGLINDRVNIEFNVYRKYTTNLLLNVAVPGSTGFTSYLANYGEVSNKGFELSITTVNFKTKDFSWTTDFNTAQNINRVEKIPAPILYAGRTLIKVQQGAPLYSYWLYKQTGVNPQTGDVIFDDYNHDGKITAADRQLVGNTWPKFFGGFNNNFSYRNFDLGIFLTYSYGNDVFNANEMLGETGGTLDANRVLLANQLNRWTTPGQITNVPRLTAANYANYENSRFFENGSFLRLRSLTLGYSVPKDVATKLHLQKLRVYFVGTNLFLVTKYTGADPETNLGGDQNIQGYDYAIPPMPRSFQLGLSVTL